jgi:hypothetical protein
MGKFFLYSFVSLLSQFRGHCISQLCHYATAMSEKIILRYYLEQSLKPGLTLIHPPPTCQNNFQPQF